MNMFLKAACQNMLLSCRNFKDGLRLAAMKDDGIISREEAKVISALEKATLNYEKELNKIMEKNK